VTAPRVPRVYFVYVLLAAAQPLVFAAFGGLDFKSRGAFIVGALLLGLAYRSQVAWWLLLAVDGVPLLATAAVAVTTRPGAWSGGVVLGLATGVALVAALTSPAMRAHVSRASRRSARGAAALR
jgi:hypothetical protein